MIRYNCIGCKINQIYLSSRKLDSAKIAAYPRQCSGCGYENKFIKYKQEVLNGNKNS